MGTSPPSLVDSLEELAKDRGYRYTSHPRVLAATLLSDWVFSQQPRSVREVVRVVLGGVGLRLALPSRRRRVGSAIALALPPKCGREELVQHCFETLKSQPVYDYALDVTDLIKANSTSQEIEGPWLEAVRRAEGEGRLRWLEYGLQLGALPRISVEKLEGVVAGGPLGDDLLALLFRARRFDAIAQREGSAEALVRMILQRRLATGPRRDESILDLLIRALDARRYSEAFRHRQPVPLSAVWDGTPGSRHSSLRLDHVSEVLAFAGLEKCTAVVEAAIVASQQKASRWASELSPWNQVVECARSSWGETWALYHLANVAGGIRSSAETCADCGDPLDGSKPLCARARYARLRAGSSGWWKRRLESGNTKLETMFLTLLLLSWGGATTLSDLGAELGEVLQGLSGGDWRQVYRSLRGSVSAHGPRAGGYLSLETMQLPSRLPPRLAVSLGARMKRQAMHAIYKRYLSDYPGSDLEVLGFCQREGFDLLRLGSKEWEAELERIKRRYAQGGDYDPYAFHQALRQGSDVQKLPLSVAEEIASQPDKYPGYLVGLAELRCRREAAEAIVPVGRIALRDQWFDQEPDPQSELAFPKP